MSGPNDMLGASERRGHDRRREVRPIAGEDRRAADRRSGRDRRGAPREG